MNDWNEQQQAAHAKALLDDPMIAEFFIAMTQQIHASWVQAMAVDSREALWYRQQALEDFRAYLTSFLASGQIVAHEEANEWTNKMR
jgi:hypothetical protein